MMIICSDKPKLFFFRKSKTIMLLPHDEKKGVYLHDLGWCLQVGPSCFDRAARYGACDYKALPSFLSFIALIL